jgi:hypothetical protein
MNMCQTLLRILTINSKETRGKAYLLNLVLRYLKLKDLIYLGFDRLNSGRDLNSKGNSIFKLARNSEYSQSRDVVIK